MYADIVLIRLTGLYSSATTAAVLKYIYVIYSIILERANVQPDVH